MITGASKCMHVEKNEVGPSQKQTKQSKLKLHTNKDNSDNEEEEVVPHQCLQKEKGKGKGKGKLVVVEEEELDEQGYCILWGIPASVVPVSGLLCYSLPFLLTSSF